MTQTDLVNLSLLKINEAAIDDIDDTGDPVARRAKRLYEPTLREVLKAAFWSFAITAAETTPAVARFLTVSGTGETDVDVKLTYAGLYGGFHSWTDNGETVDDNLGNVDFTTVYNASDFWRVERQVVGFPVTYQALVSSTAASPIGLDYALGSAGSALPTLEFTQDPELVPWAAAYALPADFLKLRRLVDSDTLAPIDSFTLRRVQSATTLLAAEFDSIILEYVAFVDTPGVYDPLFIDAFTTLLAAKLARAVTGSEKMEADLLAAYHQLSLPGARTADAQETQSAENHPLAELIAGSLTGIRGNWFDPEA